MPQALYDPEFLADLSTRRIHWTGDGSPASCGSGSCLEGVAAADLLAVDDAGEMKRMVELEAFHPCPHCMADYPWVD